MAPPPPAFDARQVSPGDAVVAIRSFRRRFAEAFDQAKDPGAVVRHPEGAGMSPLEHAAWTATALEAIGAALHRVMRADDPEIVLPPVDPGPAGPGDLVAGSDQGPNATLSHLDEVARCLADAMAAIHGDEWARTGRTPAGTQSALDVARLGVRIGVEHLRAAEHAIRAASP